MPVLDPTWHLVLTPFDPGQVRTLSTEKTGQHARQLALHRPLRLL